MKVILIDIDDTLLDFNKCSYFALKESLKECHWVMDDSFFDKFTALNNQLWKEFSLGKIKKHDLLNNRWKILFEEENIDADYHDFDCLFQKHLKNQCILMDGAIDMLEYLYNRYDLYTASNGIALSQVQRLKNANIYKYFKGMFISEYIGYPKPDIRFFDYCLKSLLCDKEDIMIIGDSIDTDMIGGVNAGIRTCFVNIRNISHDINVDYEIHSLYEIKEIL